MSWASQYIELLKNGKTVSFRPLGGSMTGRVESGQLVTVSPVKDHQALKRGDIVLCQDGNAQYLHLIKRISKGQFQIGNNKGKINGWVGFEGIFGKCINIQV